MKTRKDLKPGDTCIVRHASDRRGVPVVFKEDRVATVGRKWMTTERHPHERFSIVTGFHDSHHTATEQLFVDMTEYEGHRGDQDRREQLRRAIVGANLHFGLGRLTTDAAERIVAILQDPASQRPA